MATTREVFLPFFLNNSKQFSITIQYPFHRRVRENLMERALLGGPDYVLGIPRACIQDLLTIFHPAKVSYIVFEILTQTSVHKNAPMVAPFL